MAMMPRQISVNASGGSVKGVVRIECAGDPDNRRGISVGVPWRLGLDDPAGPPGARSAADWTTILLALNLDTCAQSYDEHRFPDFLDPDQVVDRRVARFRRIVPHASHRFVRELRTINAGYWRHCD